MRNVVRLSGSFAAPTCASPLASVTSEPRKNAVVWKRERRMPAACRRRRRRRARAALLTRAAPAARPMSGCWPGARPAAARLVDQRERIRRLVTREREHAFIDGPKCHLATADHGPRASFTSTRTRALSPGRYSRLQRLQPARSARFTAGNYAQFGVTDTQGSDDQDRRAGRAVHCGRAPAGWKRTRWARALP